MGGIFNIIYPVFSSPAYTTMKVDELAQTTHQYQRDWAGMLDFYEEEIRIFERLLDEVAHEHPDRLSILEHVEEYEAILQRKKQHIMELRSKINTLTHPSPANEPAATDWMDLDHLIRHFSADIEALKKNFRRFTAHND